jgi:hypothetical protein
LLQDGDEPGNTPYWNGSSWITNSSNIYNYGGLVGIGTSSPEAQLDVNGQIKISGGDPGEGKVLTSDANGLASWVTSSGVNGSGTPDYVPKFAGPNSIGDSQIFDNGSNVGIGMNPLYKLHVLSEGSSYGMVHTDGDVSLGTWVGTYGGYLGTISDHSLSFFTANGEPAMTISEDDEVNIHTSLGFTREAEPYADPDWKIIYTFSNDLDLYYSNNFKGSFSHINGFYTPSDRRIKTDIQAMGSTLDKVLQLKPFISDSLRKMYWTYFRV